MPQWPRPTASVFRLAAAGPVSVRGVFANGARALKLLIPHGDASYAHYCIHSHNESAMTTYAIDAREMRAAGPASPSTWP